MDYPQEKVKPYGEEGRKAEQVERMFDTIAPTYDRLNHTLSLGIDRRWRRRAMRQLLPYRPQRLLDVATGTGDFALLACRMLQPTEVVGIDLSDGMMQVARRKAAQAGRDGLDTRLTFRREDCEVLTFADGEFDAVTVAFGIRNFEHLDRGLREMHRVLAPGGRLVILGISHDDSAYTYLPASIRACPQGEAMRQCLLAAGFREATFRRLTCGICTLYVAVK